ncbi:MAG: hypothetical protein E6J42_03815 [Chloroflexi bacterium]|nr:MAG: hypothetical protein E6J42_03815 [Chloroflexota bacterium]
MRMILFAVSLTAAVVFSAACSSDSGKKTDVKVQLSEWTVSADKTSVPKGEVTFDVENKGKEDHDLVIIRTDLASDQLPAKDDRSADEGAEGLKVIGKTNTIEAGDNDSRVFTLDPGKYVLISNEVRDTDNGKEADYEKGMRTQFTVADTQ